jgi:putative transcriptional regulator
LTIKHHLDTATIMAHAAGTLDEALSVVVACHLSMCTTCREASRQASQLGGEILSTLDDTAISENCRSKTLGMLDTATLHRFPRNPNPVNALPAPLNVLLEGKNLDEIKWKNKAPGLALHDLPVSKASHGKLFLMRIAASKAMPEHGHGGEEITLILSGAYNDSLGRFAIGDVADLDEDFEHQPVVEAGAACICLVATEAPTRFKSWPARLLQPLIGI